VKSYEFQVPVNLGDNEKLIKIRSFFDKPGITVKIDETSNEKTGQSLENEIKKMKTDIYALSLNTKIIPQAFLQQQEYVKRLLESVKRGDTKMYLVKVAVDASKVPRDETMGLIKDAREIMPFADPEKYKKMDG
jgi:ribonuclease HII